MVSPAEMVMRLSPTVENWGEDFIELSVTSATDRSGFERVRQWVNRNVEPDVTPVEGTDPIRKENGVRTYRFRRL